MPSPIAIKCIVLFAALTASSGALAAAGSENKTPNSSEMTPTQWRTQQLAAADKSDQIMRDAQKQPGLLAQYLHMQLNYDLNHERAFQVIFGQYLSWYQTYIADYNGVLFSLLSAQP